MIDPAPVLGSNLLYQRLYGFASNGIWCFNPSRLACVIMETLRHRGCIGSKIIRRQLEACLGHDLQTRIRAIREFPLVGPVSSSDVAIVRHGPSRVLLFSLKPLQGDFRIDFLRHPSRWMIQRVLSYGPGEELGAFLRDM